MSEDVAPRAPRRDPYVGRVLSDRFRLEERIGSGAMGYVYRASDLRDGGGAAVKVLRPELMADWSLIKRFMREARAAQAIESPHVVRILDYGESGDDVLFIAMELLEGESLAARLQRVGAVPAAEAAHVARSIAAALTAAHAAGVVHRDLKPDNVVVSPEGQAKVVDFGIARIVEGSRAASDMVSHLTIAGTLMGTPLYMSPEAAARRSAGPPADVYALGVITFEMLTGAPPFVHEDLIRVIGMHLRVPPPRLEDAAPQLRAPASLSTLLLALMAKEPTQRPAAAEALERFDAVLAEIGPDAGPVAPDTIPEGPRIADLVAATVLDPAPAFVVGSPAPAERRPAQEPREPMHTTHADRSDATPSDTIDLLGHTHVPVPPPGGALWVGGAIAFALLMAVGIAVATMSDTEPSRGPEPAEPAISSPARPPADIAGGDRAEERQPERAPEPEEGSPPTAATAPASVTVHSDVPCQLSIDGERAGVTPVVRHEVRTGTRVLQCVARGRRPVRATVTISAGESVTRRFRLRARRGGTDDGRGHDLDIDRDYR